MFPSAAGEYEYTRQRCPMAGVLVGWTMIVGSRGGRGNGVHRLRPLPGLLRRHRPAAGLPSACWSPSLVSRCLASNSRPGSPWRSGRAGRRPRARGAHRAAPCGRRRSVRRPWSRRLSSGRRALVFFAFIGFDEVITLAEETRDPTRTVPRALLLALGVSTVLYVAVAIAAVSVLGAGALAASPVRSRTSWRTSSATAGHGGRGDRGVDDDEHDAAGADCGVADAVRHGDARGDAAGVRRPTRRTPTRAITAVAIVAAASAIFGDFTVIAAVTDFAVYIVFVAVNGTVIILRRTRPDLPRPFAVAWTIRGIPVLPLLGLGSVALMMTHLAPPAIGLGIAACGLGLAVGWLVRAWR